VHQGNRYAVQADPLLQIVTQVLLPAGFLLGLQHGVH
jgi:hypothetical protein